MGANLDMCVCFNYNPLDDKLTLWTFQELSINLSRKHILSSPKSHDSPFFPRCRCVKEITVMLSMKTGINTESVCVPSGVQRLTQDRKFNTTQSSKFINNCRHLTVLDTLYICWLRIAKHIWARYPCVVWESVTKLYLKRVCVQCEADGRSDTHLWWSLFRVLSHPHLWLWRRSCRFRLLRQDRFHTLGKFQLLYSQDLYGVGLCSFEEYPFICGTRKSFKRWLKLFSVFFRVVTSSVIIFPSFCSNLPSKLKLTECSEDLDLERLLWALAGDPDGLDSNRLSALLCLFWWLEDFELDL